MENKNEKTFSDLFLNTKNEEESSENEFTFDTLSTEVNDTLDENDDAKDMFSFSSFSDIAKSSIESDSSLKNDEKSKNIVDEDSNQVKSSSIFDVALEEVDDVADDISDDVSVDDVNVTDNVFEFNNLVNSVSNEEVAVDEAKGDNKDINVVNDDETRNDEINNNIFEIKSVNNDDAVIEAEDSDDVKKDGLVTNVVNSTDIVENVKNDIVDNEEIKNEQLTADIFGMNEASSTLKKDTNEINDVESKEEVLTADIFGMGDTTQEEKMNTVVENDKLENEEVTANILEVEETTKSDDKISAEVKTNDKVSTESNSPFFESVDSSNDSFNPLFSNTISLEETNNVQKEVGKLNLSDTKHFDVKVVPKKEPLTKFIFGVISYAFFIWLLLIGITLLVYVLDIKIRAAKGDTSSPAFNAYVVLTGSMLPDIQVNDVVITKKVDAEDLEVGDIITFVSADSRFNNAIITHRIIKKNPANKASGITFQTKGDNNNVADSALVPEANIFGKVILKIPKLGYLQEFLASQGGWIIVILIPCLTVISYDIVKIAKGVKKKKYNNIKVKK